MGEGGTKGQDQAQNLLPQSLGFVLRDRHGGSPGYSNPALDSSARNQMGSFQAWKEGEADRRG